MARSRLSLVIVLLVASRFPNTSQDDSESSSEEAQSPEKSLTSLLCVTFLEPGYNEVSLVVEDSAGTWKSFKVDLGDCATNYTDVLKIQAMNGAAKKINLKMSFGDCDMTCLKTRNQPYPTLNNITRSSKEKKVTCAKASLPAFETEAKDDGDGFCSRTVRLLKRTLTTEPPLSSTESSVVQEEARTNSKLPPSHTTIPSDNATFLHVQATAPPAPAKTSPALLTVLVVELVATCVMAVLVVWVVRSGGRNNGVTPATTDVRRNSNQDEVYICENDLYEPFTGPPAAQATGGQT